MTDFNQRNQQVNQQTNIGRDQVIQNIVLVGQFLDFAQVEGLIPKPRIPTDFSSISDAFEKTFAQRLEGDLVRGIVFASEILKAGFKEWNPRSPFSALNRRKIIDQIPKVVVSGLVKLDYWDSFAESESEILYLYSLQLLWVKHFKTEKKESLFGLSADYEIVQGVTRNYSLTYTDPEIDFSRPEEFRVFLVGLVIDLIRLYSLASDDKLFWEGFVNLVTSKSAR
ncbi:MAG: hypothetical protein HS100_19645 [Anaerolineales bacterium]|nr:hypothetical protein [Anaerolineales bacterium]